MDIQYYLDEDGYKVEIGTLVGFREEFHTKGNYDKVFTVRKLPNYGDTVIMDMTHIVDQAGEMWEISGTTGIEVEPWKIGAI